MKLCKKNLKENSYIVDMGECSNAYVFSIMQKGEEGVKYRNVSGYDRVDKKTGEVGFMFLFDYADEVEAGIVKEIDISKFDKRAS